MKKKFEIRTVSDGYRSPFIYVFENKNNINEAVQDFIHQNTDLAIKFKIQVKENDGPWETYQGNFRELDRSLRYLFSCVV